jgi:hypothetical protein
MMMHHGPENYDLAASRAARAARDKLNALIERGRTRATAVLDAVETQRPMDLLVTADEIAFEPDEIHHGEIVVVPDRDTPMPLHRHALGQVADKAGLPRTYLARLLDPEHRAFGPELLSHNLTRLFREGRAIDDDAAPTDTFLLRSLQLSPQRAEVRGFVSSRFRRLDSRPIVAAFASACERVGAVPVEGYVLDTKIAIKAILTKIYEPVANEVMVFGMALENSDYGNGALQVSFFALRLACTNGMLLEKSLRKVHLGARLSGDVVWSARTLAAETEAVAGAVHDLVSRRLNDRHILVLQDGIRRAHEERIEPARAQEFLKKHLLKSEAEAVVAAFNSPDVENMPAGQTRWRLAQAVSWIAGKTEDQERRLDLMRIAGNLVPVAEAA